MDDGLFQLLFFGALILASMFDVATRRGRRRRKMREMEREEAAEEQAQSSGRRPDLRAGSDAEERTVATAERETADSMVPEDLWAVLTGEEPPRPPKVESPPDRPRPEPVRQAEAPPEIQPPPRPIPPTPVPRGVPAPIGSAPPAPPVTRPPPVVSSSRELGGVSPVLGSRAVETADDDRASRYVRLLRSSEVDSLRQAVVLREVLGRPVAYRQAGWDPEER
jgi:hypothetical protein